MVAGPELLRMTSEFEASLERKRHHEQTKSFQMILENRSKNWLISWKRFLKETTDFLRLDTRDIVDPAVAYSVRQAETMGQEQYQTFMTDPLVEQTTHISEPIKKKNCHFSVDPSKERSPKQAFKFHRLSVKRWQPTGLF